MKFKIFTITPYKNIHTTTYDITLEPSDNFPFFLWEPSLDRDNVFNSYQEAIDYLNQFEDVLYNNECVVLPYWKGAL